MEEARKLGKAGGLIILVTSIILFVYCEASGWGFKYPLTPGGFVCFALVGALIAVAASRGCGYPSPDEAARRGALVGYKVSDGVKAKYAQSLSIAILLLLILLPAYISFFMLYTYFIVELAGTTSSAYVYTFAGWSLPVLYLLLFIYIVCFYLRGRKLRQFMWSAVKGGRMKSR